MVAVLHGSKKESKREQERHSVVLLIGIVYRIYFSSVLYCIAVYNFCPVHSQNTGPAFYLHHCSVAMLSSRKTDLLKCPMAFLKQRLNAGGTHTHTHMHTQRVFILISTWEIKFPQTAIKRSSLPHFKNEI